MARDQHDIADLKSRVSLPALIGAHVPLTKDGADLKGLCPFHDEKTPSFTVYDDHFHCYGCGANGDHLDWLQHAERLSIADAVERLASLSGAAPHRATAPTPTIGRPPADAPPPACLLSGRKPDSLTPYRDESGHTLFYVARHDLSKGKSVRPWSWDSGKNEWVSAGYPFPRPILGLPAIAADKEKPVLIVEGEKAAYAALKIAGKVYHVTTWCGGAQAIKKTDWSPLFRKRVLLWPDADRHLIKTPSDAEKHGLPIGAVLPYDAQPGPAAMRQIAAMLAPHGGEIKALDVGIDGGRADGWDAADALAEGMDWGAFVAWAKPLARVWKGADVVNLGQEREERERAPIAPARPVTLQAKWDEVGLQLNKAGSPVANLDNALRVLERWPDFKDAFWYDEFFDRFYTTWGGVEKEWEDADTLRLTTFLQRELGIRSLNKSDAKDAVGVIGKRRTVHAPRQWMESLKWDGLERIEFFFSEALGADSSAYVCAASKNFWIGMVARIYEPGCKVDNMVVMEGAQGARKSSAISLIGGDWFAESGTSITDKDFFQQLPGKMIIEIAELDAFSKADQRRIKSVLSRQVDRYRPSYGHFAKDYPRQTIFVGSTNEEHYLEDTTGGRRYWPVKCGEISLDVIRANRDQLFAEAVERFKRGETWWEMPPEETKAQQESRRERDAWEAMITEHLRLTMLSSVTLGDVARDALKLGADRLDKPAQRRVAQAMRLAGWVGSENGAWVRR